MTEQKKAMPARRSFGNGGKGGKKDIRKPRRRRRPQRREQREFEQKILELARVTRVTKGGKRMRFRTCLLIGDRKGRVGVGVAKGADVQISIEKAYRQAKKNVITVPLVQETIPHDIEAKFGASKILIKPAPKGAGLKSGGAVRMVLTLAGVPNAVSKILGGSNKINNAKATLKALKQLKLTEEQKAVQKKAEEKRAAKKRPAKKFTKKAGKPAAKPARRSSKGEAGKPAAKPAAKKPEVKKEEK